MPDPRIPHCYTHPDSRVRLLTDYHLYGCESRACHGCVACTDHPTTRESKP